MVWDKGHVTRNGDDLIGSTRRAVTTRKIVDGRDGGGFGRWRSGTSTGRIALEGSTVHCRIASDIHTGERRAISKGIRADESHRGRDGDRGEGGARVKGIITDESHGCWDGDRGEGGAGPKGSTTDGVYRGRDDDGSEGGAKAKGINADGCHECWDGDGGD